MQLIGKTIVITGGTSGIGMELVSQLREHNRVIVLARNSEKLQSLRDQYQGIDIFTIELTSTQALKNIAITLTEHYSHIDLLINAAAVQNTPLFTDEDFDFDTIEYEIKLNFTIVCQLIYLLLKPLQGNDTSIILNINSGLAIAPKKSSAVYCGTKGGLDLFSQSLGYQLKSTNIKVLQAFLPVVDTQMTAGRADGKKITAEKAASEIIKGIECEVAVNDVCKVKLLRVLHRLLPSIARNMMKKY